MRFVLAHLADWDPIFGSRIEQILTLDKPELPAFDEGQMAIDNSYATQNPLDSLARWAKNREQLVASLKAVLPEQHDRQGYRPGQGLISIAEYMAMIALHDSYHINQAVDYLAAYKAR